MESEQKQTVLIVDDRPERVRLLSELLKENYQRMAATNGNEALDIATRKKPDLILLDVMMPGMDGYEVCEKLKSQEDTRDIPVIFVTAKGGEEDEQRGFELGAVDYISEPLKPSLVKARVNTHLELERHRARLKRQHEELQEANDQLSRAMERIEQDIEVAGRAQRAMLPESKDSPFRALVDLTSRYEPEMRVGGDFFDFKALDERRMGTILADVCGHGLRAAFVTGVIKTSFELGGETRLFPQKFCADLNRILCHLTPPSSFASMVYWTYDYESRALHYVNGGHCPLPVLVEPGGEPRPLSERSNIVLGVVESAQPEEEMLELEPGTKLVMATDGVTETESDSDGEMFGYERLLDVIGRYAEEGTDEIDRAIHRELCEFRGDGPQTDDIAVLVVEFK